MNLERAKHLIFLVWSIAVLITILSGLSRFVEFLSFIYFILSCFSIVVLNIYLLKKARDHRKAVKRQHTVVITSQVKSTISEYRSFKCLTVVTFSFVVASIYNVFFTIFRFNEPAKESVSYQRMVVVSTILFAMNSAIDPLGYCITSSEFKRIYNKMKVGLFG